jgi:tetratricopeptide (TPR) repeat protein
LEPTKHRTPGSTRQRCAVGLLLVAAVALVYHPLGSHRFLILDDFTYVSENPYVQSGLTFESVRWALTKPFFTMWTPVTLLSYLVGAEIFGTAPGPTLLVNALFHALGALMLFAALARMTGSIGRSAFVAGVFALHPLHVESVAWASERKDVLCGFFWMLTLWAHARHAERPSLARLAVVWLAGALALASKPMAVTLPFTLLLLDAWPLGRLGLGPGVASGDEPGAGWQARVRVVGLRILEKLPLFLLAAAIIAWTLQTHPSAGLTGAAQPIPATLRLENALVSYVAYLGAAFWPAKLGIFYPYPASIPLWQPLAAGALLLALSAVALRGARRRGHFFVGWFWFVGTLVPVIGLVQAGNQAMADRYTYVPLVGISLAVGWGFSELRCVAARRWAAGVLAGGVLIALGWATSNQLRHWENGVTLFGHTLAVTGENPNVRSLLGLSLLEQGRIDAGVEALAAGFGYAGPTERVRPLVFRQLSASGDHKHDRGDLMTAVVYYRAAIAIQPDSAPVQLSLGRTLLRQARFDAAIAQLRTALALDPDDAESHFSLGLAFELSGQPRRAVRSYRDALRLEPGSRAIEKRLAELRAKPEGAD